MTDARAVPEAGSDTPEQTVTEDEEDRLIADWCLAHHEAWTNRSDTQEQPR